MLEEFNEHNEEPQPETEEDSTETDEEEEENADEEVFNLLLLFKSDRNICYRYSSGNEGEGFR